MGTIIIWMVLGIHLLLCAVMGLLCRIGVLKVPGTWVLAACFLPLWGELGAILCHMERSRGRDGGRRTYADEAGEVSEIFWSSVSGREDEQGVIPLEEALRINDSAVKRTMIMDILNEQPDEYIGLLKEARSNKDVEVVHYATTAMSELSKDYDLRLQALEAEYSKNPDDTEVLERYITFLEEYIGKELAQGQFLTMQRIQYGRLLHRQLKEGETPERYMKLAENELELRNYTEVSNLLDRMDEQWPDQEPVLLLRIRCYAEQGRGDEIRTLVKKVIGRGIYLTSEAKRIVEFWSKGGECL